MHIYFVVYIYLVKLFYFNNFMNAQHCSLYTSLTGWNYGTCRSAWWLLVERGIQNISAVYSVIVNWLKMTIFTRKMGLFFASKLNAYIINFCSVYCIDPVRLYGCIYSFILCYHIRWWNKAVYIFVIQIFYMYLYAYSCPVDGAWGNVFLDFLSVCACMLVCLRAHSEVHPS